LEKIVRYGERGVVDTLIHFLVENLESKKFLQSIRWADGSSKDWITSIESVSWILEVSLNRMSGFGDPDIMIVCETQDKAPHFVFIEAKVDTYEKAAGSNSKGMVEGYNSKINGQLSLKYRFCKAIEGWTQEQSIQESEILFQQYKDRIGENNRRPRRLVKKQVLNLLEKHRFHELDLDRCFFVAMT